MTTLRAPRAAACSRVERSTVAEVVTPLRVTSMVAASRPTARRLGREPVQGVGQRVAPEPEGQPPVAAAGRPTDGRRGRSAHVDGHSLRPGGSGERLHAGEGETAALEVRTAQRIGMPQGAHGIDRLVGALASGSEVHTGRLDLFA